MADIRKWAGVTVSIQSALAAADTITGITKADPGVVTATSHGISDGAYVLLTVQGMNQVDGRVFRVDNGDANTFELEGEDTTAYSTFSSGTAQAITFGTSLTTALSVNASGGEANFIDVTTVHDLVQKQIPGTASAATFSFENIWDPGDAGLLALKAASDAGTPRAVMFTFTDASRCVFNGYISCTLLPTGTAGDVVKTPVSITMFGRPTLYTT